LLDVSRTDPDLSLDCSVNSSSHQIWIDCAYLDSWLSTGFQVIAQLSDADEVHKLHINESNLETTVTITVEMEGEYEVSIFATEGERGILDSSVAYRIAVSVTSVTSTPTNTTTNGSYEHFIVRCLTTAIHVFYRDSNKTITSSW
jgi:hypothetical protein